jgi:hypothetical protein
MTRMAQSKNGLNVGEGKEASESRIGSVIFWWDEMIDNGNYLQFTIGHGLGASKSGGVFLGKLVSKGSQYYGLKLDRTGLSSLLWDIGILGTTFFFMIFVTAWSLARKTKILIGQSTFEGTMMWGFEAGIVVLAVSNIYDSYFFTNPALNAFTMLTFALVVGTMRSYRVSKHSMNSSLQT